MPNLTPRSFPALSQCDVVSAAAMASHLTLYQGYVRKYNDLTAKLDAIHARGPNTPSPDAPSLQADMIFALGAIKNHELFFDILGPESSEPAGDLAHAIVKSFHSIPQFLVDLRQTAKQGRGWVFTAYDLDLDTLFNCDAAAQNGLPLWNAVPILALDLYGHAYFYDYGNNRLTYIEAIMKSLNWSRIGTRLVETRKRATQTAATS